MKRYISSKSIFALYSGDVGRSHAYLKWLQRDNGYGMLVDIMATQWLDTIPELKDIADSMPRFTDMIFRDTVEPEEEIFYEVNE